MHPNPKGGSTLWTLRVKVEKHPESEGRDDRFGRGPDSGVRYSILSALMGEIDAARAAGTMVAKKAQIASAIAATLRAIGSQMETP